ncbi:hypothetical protein GCM10010172_51960 [Paractinoplanes ferrugineus]|uniref:Uncharacterized protein n=1 Tax=Paractinoplanes ferrugineus TaxID=113564 RepID=A0A919MGU7_9ACTN|nr:hypothetical protein Afe05nite_38250 [Actinoplanes ferrugineus]
MVRRPAQPKIASLTHMVDSHFGVAGPSALRYSSTSAPRAGRDWTNPFTDHASAPTSPAPSIAAVTAARSAGGTSEQVAVSRTSGAYDERSSAADATRPTTWL